MLAAIERESESALKMLDAQGIVVNLHGARCGRAGDAGVKIPWCPGAIDPHARNGQVPW